nr:PilZ domain-containing protein [uncultured Rhodoferax sp.]
MTDIHDDANTSTDSVLRLSLKSLGLRSGMTLQTRRLAEGATKIEAQFFGAIEGKGVMVGPAGSDATQTEMTQGDVCVVRGFTGQHEFSFVSKVLQTFEKPFAYALLAYPALVDAKQVRQSMRTKVSWPAQIRLEGSVDKQEVILVDLSPQGAMVRCATPLGAVGDVLNLTLQSHIDAAPLSIELSATLCHHSRPPGLESFVAGMAFKDLSRDDKLALHYLTQPASSA